jgi:UDP-N-acetyl-2-amino-2-deoxyglucuronate dehydrogenase
MGGIRMTKSIIGFGIVGCGTIANWHAKAIAQVQDAKLIAVADNFFHIAEEFGKKYDARACQTYEMLLDQKDVDVICICTPSGLHAPYAVMAAKSGKHVVVEKPMALDLIGADEIIRACDDNRVKMEVISQLRFTFAIKKLKEAVGKGLLGKIVTGDIYMKYYRSQEYYDTGGWRGTWKMDGGGALMNQGIHGVDLLQYVMGSVKKVTAVTKTLARDIEVEDTAAALLEYENGAIGVIQAATSVYPGYPRRLEICGTLGSIVLEEDSILKWDIKDQKLPSDIELGRTTTGAASDPKAFGVEGHVLQISDMVQAIKNDRETLVGPCEGRKPIEIITAVYESSISGAPVFLKTT